MPTYPDSKVALFLLGKKGLEVLRAALRGGFQTCLAFVVVGQDRNIRNDYSGQIIDLCRDENIKYFLRAEYSRAALSVDTHIAIAAGWRWLIKDDYRRVIVFHDSLLPKYRGFNPLVTALLRRDPKIGVTVIIGNEAFDRGDVIEAKSAQVTYPVKISDAIDVIGELYFELGRSLLRRIQRGESLAGKKQDENEATYSVWRDEEDYNIDWSRSADEISHFVNCVSYPYKGAATACGDMLIRVLETEVVPDVEIANRDVGKVLFVDQGKPVVICGRGLLKLVEAVDDDGVNALPLSKFRIRLRSASGLLCGA